MIYHPNLEWYYPFDKNIKDKSANGHHLSQRPFKMEGGTVTVNDTADYAGVAATVTFQNAFHRPVVLTFIVTRNGNQLITSHARSITSTGCEIVMYEPDEAGHAAEDVGYLVVEEGVWEFPDGNVIEAGVIHSAGVHTEADDVATVGSEQYYAHVKSDPVLLADVQTDNASHFKTALVDSGKATDKLVAAVSYMGTGLTTFNEDIGYICFDSPQAISSLTTESGSVTIEWGEGMDGTNDGLENTPHDINFQNSYPSKPVLILGSMSTGNDGHIPWIDSEYGPSSAEAFAAEDPIGDTEQSHADVRFSWIVFDQAFSVNTVVETHSFVDGAIKQALSTGWSSILYSETSSYQPSDTIGDLTIFFWSDMAPSPSNVNNGSYNGSSIVIASYDRNEKWSIGANRGEDNDEWEFSLQGNTTGTLDVKSGHVIDGVMHFYAVTYTKSTGEVKFYLDGNLIKTVQALNAGEEIGDTSSSNTRGLLVLTNNEYDPNASIVESYDPFPPGTRVQHLGYLEGTACPEADIKRLMLGLSPLHI